MKGREQTGRVYLPGRYPVEVLLAVLGGGPRFEIVKYLAATGESSVTAIAGRLELAINTISHHLAILRGHHLVDVSHHGTVRKYRLSCDLRASISADGLVLHIRCRNDIITIQSKEK